MVMNHHWSINFWLVRPGFFTRQLTWEFFLQCFFHLCIEALYKISLRVGFYPPDRYMSHFEAF